MSSADITYLVFFFVFLAVSCIVTMIEISYVNLSMIRVRHLEGSNVRHAGTVARIKEDPGRLLSTTSLINAVADTIVAAFGTMLFVSALGRGVGTPLGIIVIALVALIIARMTPKLVAAQHAEGLSLFLARPTALLLRLMSRIVNVTSWIPIRLAILFGGKPTLGTLVTKEELTSIISVGEEEGVVTEEEAAILRRAVKFGTRHVREVMTPRTELAFIEKSAKLADFLDAYSRVPAIRYPVYERSHDEVISSIAVRDVLLAFAQGTLQRNSSLKRFLRPILPVPGNMEVGDILNEMQSTGFMMAVVVNEYGGTNGVVNIEDLVEEIVGELGEDLAGGRPLFELIVDRGFKVSGKMRVDDANERLGLEIPQGEYQTVAGYALSLFAHMPDEGEEAVDEGLRIVIQKVKDNKIQELLLSREPDGEMRHGRY
ncbi:hemolysin family protein [Chloroflexota bacterium]